VDPDPTVVQLMPERGSPLYASFCSDVLWPLLHGFPSRVRLNEGAWDAYMIANEAAARGVLERAGPRATVWIHDYPQLLVARALRELGHRGRIGLFVHVPFPAAEVLDVIPWGPELVAAMCEHDLIGFQTRQFATSFLAAASARRRHKRMPEIGVFPETIDIEAFRVTGDDVREIGGLRASLDGCRLLLAVDTLDHTKGIPERLDAYERLLERYPEWQRKVSLLQVATAAHADDPALRERIERMVGRINGRFGDTDWVPVRYLVRAFEPAVLAQLYRLADVALVTPLRDGMNLVAKQFVAAQAPDAPGVLVLSQYAGAADALVSAVITNPFHPEGLAADIDHALRMPLAERVQRHRVLASALEREGDPQAWAIAFLERLAPRRLRLIDGGG
jgi:trehalose 6-phosphate synthase